jgi:hypothetical protein
VMRVYFESQNKKTYHIKEVFMGKRKSSIKEELASVH